MGCGSGLRTVEAWNCAVVDGWKARWGSAGVEPKLSSPERAWNVPKTEYVPCPDAASYLNRNGYEYVLDSVLRTSTCAPGYLGMYFVLSTRNVHLILQPLCQYPRCCEWVEQKRCPSSTW